MGLKLFLFHTILMFNVVHVYSMSCFKLTSPGIYKLMNGKVIIKKIREIKHLLNWSITVFFDEAFFVSDRYAQVTQQELRILSCTTTSRGKSQLNFAENDTHKHTVFIF